MDIKIGLCLTCIGRNLSEEFQDFSNQIESELKKQRPDINWNIEGQSCFRFCPNDRIAMSIPRKEDLNRGRVSMSKDTSVESIVALILRENY